jgi:hypothetical protein
MNEYYEMDNDVIINLNNVNCVSENKVFFTDGSDLGLSVNSMNRLKEYLKERIKKQKIGDL